MIKKIAILGSTGSIGSSTLSILKKQKNFKVRLLTANRNINKIYKQACQFKVKDVIIEDKLKYLKFKNKFKNRKIKLHLGLSNLKKILNFNIDYSMNAISGLNGLGPTLDIIPKSKNMLIANKESIICGWNLIFNKLKKHNTKFIPIDSEHFSIWKLIENEKHKNIEKIILTASGGPFLNLPKKKYYFAKPRLALKHPNWKMGKKISIDSSTMMNKVFEVIEAKHIFNLEYNKISILTHPKSYVHAIVKFNNGLSKILIHEPNMVIPIYNSIYSLENTKFHSKNLNFKILNNLEFNKVNTKKFPLVNILNNLPEYNSLYETALVIINDFFVNKFLLNKISYMKMIDLINKYANKRFILELRKINVKNVKNIYEIRDYLSFKLNTLGI